MRTFLDAMCLHQICLRRDYNRRQNELRPLALNWAFLHFTDFKKRKYSFSCPILSNQCFADVRATIENNKHRNFEQRGQGRGAYSFVLWSYPIWVHCRNNFVADCRNEYVTFLHVHRKTLYLSKSDGFSFHQLTSPGNPQANHTEKINNKMGFFIAFHNNEHIKFLKFSQKLRWTSVDIFISATIQVQATEQ